MLGRTRWAISVCFVAALCAPTSSLSAEDANGEGAKNDAPKAITTADPEISVDHLKLLVKPLTREELGVEASAWRDLLKAKVQEISDLQIGVKKQNEKLGEIDEQVEQLEEEVAAAKAKAGDASPDDNADADTEAEKAVATAEKAVETAAEATNVAEATTEKAEALENKKMDLAEELPELQTERTELIDRLNVVVDAWEAKGGDVEEYRQYVTAVSGLDLDVTDASTTWTALSGWLTSEQGGQRWLWNIAKFVLILAAFYVVAWILGKLVFRATSRISGASELLKKFLATFVKQCVMVIGIIVAISALELNISPLLAAIGGAAFVIGFALQGTLSNFASGLIILGYRPFDVGDVIDAAGISGIVDSMNLLSTKVRTFDNKVMIVPNNKIATDTITNATASDTRRVDMVFGIGYGDDIDQAKSILESIVRDHELVLEDPAPVVHLHELGDSSVNFICRPWVKAADYWAVYWDITKTVKQQFDENGISIPFPQRDVHVYQESPTNGQHAVMEEQRAT